MTIILSFCEKIKIEIVDFKIGRGTYEERLGAHFDNRLTFDYHISELCTKASKKLKHWQ